MNLRTLYKKQIELLRLSKKFVDDNDFNKLSSVARDAYPDLFYKSNEMLKDEFVELYPPEELARVRRIIDFSRYVSARSSSEYFASYRGISFERDILIQNYEWLITRMGL